MTLIEMIEQELDEKLDPIVVDVLLTLDSETDRNVRDNFWMTQLKDPEKKSLLSKLKKSKTAREFLKSIYFTDVPKPWCS